MKTVSVIIPVFNNAVGVAKTLDGLCRQTWPMENIEVIVVDNGSDEPPTLHSEYPFLVRTIQCETPGSYAARNAGAALATGTALAFTDADCVPCQHWLERGMRDLIDGDGKVIIGGNVIFTALKSPSSVALYQITMGFGQESNIRDKGFSATANLFCTRTQFEKIGPFDERLFSGGDREWSWRARAHNINVRYMPDAIVYTSPRSKLGSAVRQARRIVAGRVGLRRLGLAHIGDSAVDKHRTGWRSARWILANPLLGSWDKLRILSVATLIWGAAAFESMRLALGGKAERR